MKGLLGKLPFEDKLVGDVLWNYASLAVIGFGGLLLNGLVAFKAGSYGLGVFNQIYACFIILSQLAVFGLNASAQRHAASHASEPNTVSLIGLSALAMSAVSGMVVATATVLVTPVFTWAFDSSDVGQGVAFAAPGLFFMSLNKVILGVLNGLRCMKAFAVLQLLRFMLLAGFVGTVAVADAPAAWMGAGFSFAEAMLFVPAFMHLGRGHLRRPGLGFNEWVLKQLHFSARSFSTGLLQEANFRIDVIVLGIFTTSYDVGVYSLAATIIEGIYNVLCVLRVNFNPLLVVLIMEGKIPELEAFVARTQRWIYPLFIVCMAIALLAIKLVFDIFFVDTQFPDSFSVLTILSVGIALYSGFMPFDFILLQGGHPGQQTLYMALQLATLVVFSLTLIPLWGFTGAGVAVALSMTLSIFWLNYLVFKNFGFHLTNGLRPAWVSKAAPTNLPS